MLDATTYSATVVVVVVTTLVTPPALRWSTGRRLPEAEAEAPVVASSD